jgi:hypothetical protein
MSKLLYPLIEAFTLQPVFAPLCFIIICVLMILMLQIIWTSACIGIANLKRLHQIPCPDCRFFTDDFRLKCTVHPNLALTEEALNCCDFCSKKTSTSKYYIDILNYLKD